MVNEFGVKTARPNPCCRLNRCSSRRLEIAPDRIHFLKFILEGYDGLAVLSTVNAEQGLVELRYPAEVEQELSDLLHEIGPEIVKNINKDSTP